MAPRVVILGSGPAGLTAALYLSRANLAPLVLEGEQPGGQLTITTDVDNFPGFPQGIMGPELMERMKTQVERFGTTFMYDSVVKADLSASPMVLTTEGGETIEASAVVIATGASARWLGLENETRLRGRGVSACATCDGFFFQNVPVAVIGGGDSAIEEASFLTRFASKVYLVHRRDKLRASKIMQDRAFNNDKIEIIWNHSVVDVLGDEKCSGVRLRDTVTSDERDLPLSGLFLGIGHVPNTAPFKGQIDLDDSGYIQTAPDSTATNLPGVYAAGDVQDTTYRQAVTAAGTGCMAAMEVEKWLEAQHDAQV
ncbi:MAG: thioredoxin reductase (NADPH) [Kiritimatiellia bacterium]